MNFHFRAGLMYRVVAAIVVIACVEPIVLCVREVSACVSCSLPSDVLSPSHPKSFEIALATRAAIEAGYLQPTAEEVREREGRTPIGLQQAASPVLLRQWLSRITFKPEDTRVIHFLLIDIKERHGVAVEKGSFRIQETPSAESGAMIVMTRHALHAIANSQLDFKRSVELGIVVVEGELPSTLLLAAESPVRARS